MRVIDMKTTTSLAAACLALLPGSMAPLRAQNQYPFQNADLPLEQRVDNILSLMTLDEKLACLTTSTAVPRLHIPDAGGSEGLHGLVRKGDFNQKAVTTTQFPEVIGMASTWDPELVRRAGAVQGYEARYIYQNEKYKSAVLVVWGPNADLARDPRWGRNNESYGEDAFFTGTMAVAFIKGMQGDDPKYWQAASLMKHFLANSNETTRGSSSSDFDEQLLRDYYSVPFRMGFVEGGAKSFMASYNAWNHVPMTVNPILRSLAMKEWGADGIVSSDALAVELMVNPRHYYKTQEIALAEALKAGIGQVLAFLFNVPKLAKQALDDHLLTEQDIDAVLRGKFRTVIRLGLLDPPAMVPYASVGGAGEVEPWTTEKHKRVALDMARESVVLLKNANGFLPLDKNAVKSIAVVGPRAGEVLIDLYGGRPPYAIAPLQGIREKVGSGATVNYAADNTDGAAVKAAHASEVAVVVVGNHPTCGATNIMAIFNMDVSSKPCADPGEGREGRDRESIDLSQEELIKQVYAANPKTVVVLVSSFPYAINWTQQNVPAVLHIAHAAQEQGTAIADVLFGDYNPAGRLNQTWPKSLDQLPPMMDYDIRHGRTYTYFKGEPLYPFGYGLSYTTFQYSHLHAGSGRVSVTVTNTGTRPGDEVVQLYVRRAGVKQLRGFQRVSLQPREKRAVEIPLKAEPGTQIVAGGSSADERMKISAK
ncbi:MAG TPA: glycoside hydrolase family 3 C-terminal domain-containing protein [Bryobacteraceae bacterium]|nr:glycoside hydrolase family 3 C-terminal domain-containing protein [Bryobacteraceae bacterium]